MSHQFPRLRSFLGAYFNQDWDADYSDEEEVLRAFVTNEPGENVRGTLSELREFLGIRLDDERLKTFVQRELLCEYEPEGMTMRAWLEHVADYLTASANQRDD